MSGRLCLGRRGALALVMQAIAPMRPRRAQALPEQLYPGPDWGTEDPAIFRHQAVAEVRERLQRLPTTAMMVVVGGRTAFVHGDVTEVSYLASVRKSIVSMLFGRAHDAGQVDLDATLGAIGIDDVQPLSAAERSARIRDLLTARSGVYHPPGSRGDDAANRPARGTVPAGTQFHYNNWDFNALETVFATLTGRDIFDAFAADLATPLGLQDFDPLRQRLLGDPARSRHLAHHFFLSARDMARLGLLMVRQGNWASGQGVLSAAWVRESTRLHVPLAAMGEPFRRGSFGYGYLWWVSETRRDPAWQGAFMAVGNFGQYLICLPAIDMVVVHRRAVTDAFAIARNAGVGGPVPAGVAAGEVLAMVETLLAGR